MTADELRSFLFDRVGFCGCGTPAGAAAALRDLLRLFPAYEHRAEWEEIFPDEGLRYLVLYMLDNVTSAREGDPWYERQMIEHGGEISGSWLTPFGTEVLAALEGVEDFEELVGPE